MRPASNLADDAALAPPPKSEHEMTRTRWLLRLAVGITALGPPAGAQDVESDLPRKIREYLGVTPEGVNRIRAGEILSVPRPETENELAVVIALLVPGAVGELFEEIRSNAIFEVDLTTIASRRVDGASPPRRSQLSS